MKRLAALVLIVISILFIGSAGWSEQHFKLNIKPGPEYNMKIQFLFWKMERPASIACWLETTNGKFVQTIFVSQNTAKNKYYAAPKEGRPEALPVWKFASDAAVKTDADSGATPAAGAGIDKSLSDIPAGIYKVRFEINKSFDYNDTFSSKLKPGDPHYSGVNGQPSIVYEGTLETGKGPATVQLKPAGTGSVSGTDGELHSLDGLTTALNMVQAVELIFQ